MEFDKVTHKRDSKGNINSENHYILKITNGVQSFERPPKSGIYYSANGKLLNPSGAIDTMSSDLLPDTQQSKVAVQVNSATVRSK